MNSIDSLQILQIKLDNNHKLQQVVGDYQAGDRLKEGTTHQQRQLLAQTKADTLVLQVGG
jgi:hypothetical protein